MKSITVFCLTLTCAVYCLPSKLAVYQANLSEWTLFKEKYNKAYGSEKEDQMRFKVYLDNKDIIHQHNLKFLRGETTFFLEMNKFGDMIHSEFVQKMNGYKVKLDAAEEEIQEYSKLSLDFLEPANVELPAEVDWRKQGAVTPVKDQGPCGSCWAFSATGSLEGQHFRHNGTLISLSEQNLIDCCQKFGNDGCEGGLMNNAFTYVKANRGIDTEKSYPYEGVDDRCKYNPRYRGANDAGYVKIPAGNEAKLQAAVATVGPVSVAIDAGGLSFQFYKGGVYYEPECDPNDLDHGVLAVGYGTDLKTKKPYWLVKNSWGTSWGEQGYIRMSRNRGNNCGIATAASYPLVKSSTVLTF